MDPLSFALGVAAGQQPQNDVAATIEAITFLVIFVGVVIFIALGAIKDRRRRG